MFNCIKLSNQVKCHCFTLEAQIAKQAGFICIHMIRVITVAWNPLIM